MLKEFKAFVLRGNVIDLAVAVVIGGAFGAIVSSLVDDVITPLLLNPMLEATGAADIASLTWGAVKYGNFLAAIIKFVLIALVLFMVVRSINKLQKPAPAAPAPPPGPTQEELLTEIRDLLKK